MAASPARILLLVLYLAHVPSRQNHVRSLNARRVDNRLGRALPPAQGARGASCSARTTGTDPFRPCSVASSAMRNGRRKSAASVPWTLKPTGNVSAHLPPCSRLRPAGHPRRTTVEQSRQRHRPKAPGRVSPTQGRVLPVLGQARQKERLHLGPGEQSGLRRLSILRRTGSNRGHNAIHFNKVSRMNTEGKHAYHTPAAAHRPGAAPDAPANSAVGFPLR